MDRSLAVSALVDELVAAVEERDLGDPDAGDWLVDARIRRIERALLAAYRTAGPPQVGTVDVERDRRDQEALVGVP